jgi:serine/threonine-protein kinase
MPIGLITAITYFLLEALDELESKDVAHRDIKPPNVIVDTNGKIWVTDFGIARIVPDKKAENASEGRGDIVGTPAYIAPESIKTPHSSTPKVDTWAVGVIAWEMLQGSHPFPEKTTDHPMEIISRVMGIESINVEKQVTRARGDVPSALIDVVTKLLESDPEERYSAKKARGEIENRLQDELAQGQKELEELAKLIAQDVQTRVLEPIQHEPYVRDTIESGPMDQTIRVPKPILTNPKYVPTRVLSRKVA